MSTHTIDMSAAQSLIGYPMKFIPVTARGGLAAIMSFTIPSLISTTIR